MLACEHTRVYPLVQSPTLGARCWTDSSFEPDSGDRGFPTMRLCAIVANSSSRAGVVCDVPAAFYPLLSPRKTQISVGELWAVLLAFKHFGKILEDASTIGFVDNIGVIHMIVNGTAKEPDLGSLTLALHLRMAELRSTCWWEYVPSLSNISDGGSRAGVSCAMASAARIPLVQVPFMLPPPSFPLVRTRDWRDWWHCYWLKSVRQFVLFVLSVHWGC